MESTIRHLSRLILPQPFIETGLFPSQSSSNPDLLRVLFGLQPPTFVPPEKKDESPVTWFDETLNEGQKEAVRFVLGMQEVGCIHGPPGVSCREVCVVEIDKDDNLIDVPHCSLSCEDGQNIYAS